MDARRESTGIDQSLECCLPRIQVVETMSMVTSTATQEDEGLFSMFRKRLFQSVI